MTEHPNVSRIAIEELRTTRAEAVRRALGYAVAALPPLALLALHLVGAASGALAAVCAATGALWWLRARALTVDAERRIADELILHGWRTTAPESFDWRVRELTSPRSRRALARALERQADPASMPVTIVRLPRERVQTRVRIERLASRLRDPRRPVDPRGLVLASRLVADVEGSSLYRPGDAPKLERQLAQVERLLDPAA